MAARPGDSAQDRALKEKQRQAALERMDVLAIARAYIQALVESAQGYKGLLLDKETMRATSTLFGRTELAEHNVVHIERLDEEGPGRRMHKELKALCFLRPTRDNVTFLRQELRAPRFLSYNVYFTNLLPPSYLQDLADADCVQELVKEVQEYYADFCVVDESHFQIPVPRNDALVAPKMPGQASVGPHEVEAVDRFVQGLSALFLAVRKRPVIRFQRGSEVTRRLAEGLYQLTYKAQAGVFDFGLRSSPILLLLDRRDDPVTPLLTQWTYQAMIHEFVGIEDNIVRLQSTKIAAEAREMVLDPRQDDFFGRHANANYGEVGLDVKRLVEQFAATSEKHRAVHSLEDMRRFVTEHMDFQKLQSNVSKHVNVMTELSEAISKRGLMELSMMEQDLANPASNLSPAVLYDELVPIMGAPHFSDKDKVRLALLYVLRFESDGARVRQMQELLASTGVRDRSPKLYDALELVLRYAGQAKRAGDLYATRSIMGRAKAVFKGLQGVDNVYTQHTPLLTATLTLLSTDKLDTQAYPYQAGSNDEALALQAAFKRTPPREVIVFIAGGSTLEEARNVHEWNERNPHMRVILGGSALLNTDQFLNALCGHVFEKPKPSEEPPKPRLVVGAALPSREEDGLM